MRGGKTGGKGRGHGREMAHTTVTETEAEASNSSTAAAPTQVFIPGLTSEQIQHLLSLIEVPKSGYNRLSGKVMWMFDSGASRHVTENSSVLEETESILPISIGLPDGPN